MDGEERPLGAFIVSFIGGILILGVGALLGAAGGSASAAGVGVGGIVEGLGALGVLFGLLIIILAAIMFYVPDYHLGCGVGILVLSLLSIVSGAGLFLGLILGVIGGILGIVFHPSEDMEFESVFGSQYRVCRNCGARAPESSRYCPSCAAPMS